MTALPWAKKRFADRHTAGELDRLTAGRAARQLKLAEQYEAFHKGDVARRLQLHMYTASAGHPRHGPIVIGESGTYPHGQQRHVYYHGRVSPLYSKSCFWFRYNGHHDFAGLCWYPRWEHWVNWSWHRPCQPTFDPRPLWCRPVSYRPYTHWDLWQMPVWVSLPAVSCGTWVDVAPVVVAGQLDLQLLAVRFVDPGHPEEKLGPRYRIWFRNNSDRPITQAFNVMLFASNDETLTESLPKSGVRITSMETGGTQSVDVRLPIEAFAMGRDKQGAATPFVVLHVLVDSNRDVTETSETNNGARIRREDILPVDPAAFEVKPSMAVAGGEVVLAGEGFGPQPGRLLVRMGGLELEGEILGWYDLGVRATLPSVPLAADTEAELVVVRGDGAAANPLTITVTPPTPTWILPK